MKKFLSIFLSIVVLLSVFSAVTLTASAEEYTEGYYKFTLEADDSGVTYATITDCSTDIVGNVTVPTHLGGPFKVKHILAGAFDGCDLIESITIGENIESIGAYAFMGCENIRRIVLPSTPLSISSGVFSDTAFYKNSNNWDKGVLYIGTNLIKAEESISGLYQIKSGTTSIAWSAFEDCTSLKSVKVPDSVEKIGMYAFDGCTALESMTLPFVGESLNPENDEYFSYDHFSYIFGGSSEWDNDEYVPASLKTVVITKDTNIAKSAFEDCSNIESITIPSTVKSIGEWAFFDCYKLKNVIIKNGVESIDREAFRNCMSIAEITIPNSVKNISEYVFSGCDSIQKITLPFTGSDIDGTVSGSFSYIFYNGIPETLKEVVITKATKIGSHAFNDCQYIESISIPSTVKKIEDYAFYNCTGLKRVNITDLGAWCKIDFNGYYGQNPLEYAKNLYINGKLATNIVIPSGIEVLNWYTFKNCTSLESVVIQNGVEQVGHQAFSGCSNLKSITLPKTLKWIQDSAFGGCGKLTTVYFLGSQSQKSGISFNNYNDNLKNAKWYYDACYNKSSHSYKTTTTAATLKKDGKIVKKCSVCGKSTTTTIKKIKSVKISEDEYTYNGKTRKPTVTVKDSNGNKLKKDTDYTVKYASGRKNVGKYKVTISFKGKYSGSKTLYFEILPKKTSVSKVTAAKKSLKVKIKKQSKQVTGYKIQYSTSSKFKSAKTKTIKSYKTTSATIKQLKAKKTYYVRVCTYKTVNGKKYYSDWSKAVKKKTK